MFLFFIWDLLLIGIFTPGINLLCFNLLSSTTKSISFEIPKKFNETLYLKFGEKIYYFITFLLVLLFLFVKLKILIAEPEPILNSPSALENDNFSIARTQSSI